MSENTEVKPASGVVAKDTPDNLLNGGVKGSQKEFADINKNIEFKPGISCDVGTANIVCTRMTKDNTYVSRYHRNMLYPLAISDESSDLLDRSDYLYVKSGNKYYIVGDDALRLKNAIGTGEIIRPMENGVLNPNLKESSELLFFILKSVIGNQIVENECLRFSVPGNPCDKSFDNLFHKMVLKNLFERMNFRATHLNEAMAVGYDCNPIMKTDSGDVIGSGISISMGGGMCNIALMYKGVELNAFSVTNSGDYIDQKASEATGISPSKIILAKEKNLDLNNVNMSDRVQVALSIYYDEMIDRLIYHMSKRFVDQKSEVDGELEIVIAGGTSMAKGLVSRFESKIKDSDMPFKIYRVRHADSPFYSVSQGLCLRAQADYIRANK